MNIKRRKILKGKILRLETKCVLVFEYFQTEEFASWNFVNCFVICFDVGGLAKNKEGKGPWNYFDYLHCGNWESSFDNEKCADIGTKGE